VVHARAAADEEATDRRVVVERRKQLDPVAADVQRDSLGSLRRDRLASLDRRAEHTLVCGHSLVEVADRDADVVNAPGRHARMLVEV
jgi:hypothetical protein